MPRKSTLSNLIDFLWDIFKIIIISLLIIVPIRYFIVQPFFVRGSSMEPSYIQGDYLLVDELSYRFSEPNRGDVIIFRFPGDPSLFYIKRIIGLPSESVTVQDGRIVIENSEVPQGFVLEEDYIGKPVPGNLKIKIDDNEYFVLGDNRDASYDSRSWGPLNRNFIVGRVLLRAWPFSNADFIDRPAYSY